MRMGMTCCTWESSESRFRWALPYSSLYMNTCATQTHRCKRVEFPTVQITQKIYIWLIHLYKQNRKSLGPVTLAHICSQGPLLNSKCNLLHLYQKNIYTSWNKEIEVCAREYYTAVYWNKLEGERTWVLIPHSWKSRSYLFYFCSYSAGERTQGLMHTK